MTRVTFSDDDGNVYWFDPATATRYDQGTRWDGNNNVGIISGSQWVDEYLYRTAGGRWIVNHDRRRYHNGDDSYRYVTNDEARDWLIKSEVNDDAIEEHFGDLEEERGPGRPPIGAPINWRPGPDLLARVDQAAVECGLTRSDMLRELVEGGLTSHRVAG